MYHPGCQHSFPQCVHIASWQLPLISIVHEYTILGVTSFLHTAFCQPPLLSTGQMHSTPAATSPLHSACEQHSGSHHHSSHCVLTALWHVPPVTLEMRVQLIWRLVIYGYSVHFALIYSNHNTIILNS